MPNLTETHEAAHSFDHIVRGLACRFVDDKRAVNCRWLDGARHAGCDWRDARNAAARHLTELRFLRVFGLLQQYVDVMAVFFGPVWNEKHLRRASQMQAFDKLMANET